jgi:hypothetical protein
MYLSWSSLRPLAVLLAYVLTVSRLGIASASDTRRVAEHEKGPDFNGTHRYHFNESRPYRFNDTNRHRTKEERPHHVDRAHNPKPIGGHVRPGA